MTYKRVTQDDVYKKLVSISLDIMNPIGGAINIKNIAHLLETSRYQVKKYIDELKLEGFVELVCITLPYDDESDYYPPYWGYILTEKAKLTDYYKSQQELENNLIQECFGV